jgi:hypothetical protein
VRPRSRLGVAGLVATLCVLAGLSGPALGAAPSTPFEQTHAAPLVRSAPQLEVTGEHAATTSPAALLLNGARVDDISASVSRTRTSSSTQVLATEGIATPFGVAEQGGDAASQALREEVGAGATVYRQGEFGVQETGGGQFWAGENPLTTPGYAAGYGTPGGAAEWVMGGEVGEGEPFVTRLAPGLGSNTGGNPEVVTNPGGVGGLWFHMP